jgi:hypothetical protein
MCFCSKNHDKNEHKHIFISNPNISFTRQVRGVLNPLQLPLKKWESWFALFQNFLDLDKTLSPSGVKS